MFKSTTFLALVTFAHTTYSSDEAYKKRIQNLQEELAAQEQNHKALVHTD